MTMTFSNHKLIKLLNIALIPEGRSNLIFLGQLYETNFIYYDKPIKIILIKKKKIVAYAKQDQNLFVLEFIKLDKAMTIGCKRSIYIINKNKQI